MKKLIFCLVIILSSNSYSQTEWELVNDLGSQRFLEVEAFSKDTFAVSTYYNSLRNGNVTFEWAILLTTDSGESWKRIYQDSTSVSDLPREPLRIQQIEVNNSVLGITREDGYFLISYDYGETWDSLYIYEGDPVGSRLESVDNYFAIYSYESYYILYDIETKDTTRINFERPFVIFNNDTITMAVPSFKVFSENFCAYLSSKIRADTSFSYLSISRDKGKTWEHIENDHHYVDILFLNDTVAYASGLEAPDLQGMGRVTAVLDKSTDGGKTWSNLITTDFFGYFDEFTLTKSKIFVTTEFDFSYSCDIGLDNWAKDTVVNFERIYEGGCIYEIDCDENENCLASYQSGLITRLIMNETNVEYDKQEPSLFGLDSQIYDMTGKQVIDMTNLPSGAYIKVYKDKNGNYVKTEKLIIAR